MASLNPLILLIRKHAAIIMIVLITLMMEGTTMKTKMIIMMMGPNIKVGELKKELDIGTIMCDNAGK